MKITILQARNKKFNGKTLELGEPAAIRNISTYTEYKYTKIMFNGKEYTPVLCIYSADKNYLTFSKGAGELHMGHVKVN